MTDEPDPPPIVLSFPAPARDAMSERGARPVAPPPPEPAPEPFVTESKSEQLRYIVQVAVANGQAIDWAVTMALNVIDSGKTPSALLRFAARQHLRRLAEEVTTAGEETSLRASAVFAVLAYSSDRQKRFEPPPTADVKLDLSLLDVCNLCAKRPSVGNGFTLTWPDAELGVVRARYCGECVAKAIAAASRRQADDGWEF